MQAKSAGEGAYNWFNELIDSLDGEEGEYEALRVQSYLGGGFLRMYLDHRVDPELVRQAGEAMAVAPSFAMLREGVTNALQATADRQRRSLTTEQVASVAHNFLVRRLRRRGIAFRETLNPVIGGVAGIRVDTVREISRASLEDRTVELTYELQVTFSDTYDFDNRRTGQYGRYRRRLADLLAEDRYEEFNLAYFHEAQPLESLRVVRLDYASTFASFMYALERKGWTPGPLPWEVTIPMRVVVRDRLPTR